MIRLKIVCLQMHVELLLQTGCILLIPKISIITCLEARCILPVTGAMLHSVHMVVVCVA